jgi:hypothetical protein
MRKHMDLLFERVYPNIVRNDVLGKFCQDPSTTEKSKFRELFIEAFSSAATRYIQYEYHFRYMTYMPVLECSNFTPYLKPPVYECVDAEGNLLTTCNLGYPSTYGIPGLEAHLGRPFSEVKKDLPKIVSEKEFD